MQTSCEQFKKSNNMKKTTAITIILILIFILGFGLRGKVSGEKFNSQKWKTTDMNSENDFSLRWDMMNSLRNNYKLNGMKKSEIINLLGKPDSTFSTPKTFRYFLGYAHSGIDTGSLIIKFNDETVEKHLVTKG
jgi:hypothetical protein